MDQLVDALSPYRETIGQLAGLLTVAQFLSGCFTCNEIRLRGSSAGFSPLRFIAGSGLSILQLRYSQMLRAKALILTSSYTLAISLLYSGWFLWYTPKGQRTTFYNSVLRTALVTGGFLFYVHWEEPTLVMHRFGLAMTVLTLAFIGIPLMQLGAIIRSKSSADLPLATIMASTGASVLWLVYGMIIQNAFIVIQKLIALGLCAVQLSLFIIYPAGGTGGKRKKTD